jgi:hypothetical protein
MVPEVGKPVKGESVEKVGLSWLFKMVSGIVPRGKGAE